MAFRLRSFLASIILFGTVTSGMLLFAGGMFTQYGVQHDTSPLADSASQAFEDANETVQQSQENADDVGGGIAEGLFYLRNIWNVVSLTVASIGTMFYITAFVEGVLGLPAWFTQLVTSIVTIFVVYEIVSLYRGIRS